MRQSVVKPESAAAVTRRQPSPPPRRTIAGSGVLPRRLVTLVSRSASVDSIIWTSCARERSPGITDCSGMSRLERSMAPPPSRSDLDAPMTARRVPAHVPSCFHPFAVGLCLLLSRPSLRSNRKRTSGARRLTRAAQRPPRHCLRTQPTQSKVPSTNSQHRSLGRRPSHRPP